jgi:hypothetical protein
MPTELRTKIERATSDASPNFPRILNKDFRPVIKNANIGAPGASSPTVFITGIPSARDNYRQFLTPVYPVFSALECQEIRTTGLTDILIQEILSQNEILKRYIRE